MYREELQALAGGDQRIQFIPRLPFDEMVKEYATLDLLAIPSIWPETGPLTLLEAAAMGVEAWGSAEIGQMETLKQHGRVVSPNTVEEWRKALQDRLDGGDESRPPGGPVRTMGEVAEEMAEAYQRITASRT
jgi:glycosyltransferase involved in cell wall biosynthesis